MYFNRKNSHINVLAGSPWQAASIHNLLHASYIEASIVESRNSVSVSVPSQYYSIAVRLMSAKNFI